MTNEDDDHCAYLGCDDPWDCRLLQIYRYERRGLFWHIHGYGWGGLRFDYEQPLPRIDLFIWQEEVHMMAEQTAKAAGFLGRGPLFWGVLFFIAMFGGAVLAAFMLEGAARLIVMVLPLSLLYPMMKAAEAGQADCGNNSQAMVRYNRRVLIASLGYVLGLGVAITLWNEYDLAGSIVFAIAMLPTLPTFGIIWAMGRYLVEETDEYLRYRTIHAAVISLGLVLALGIFWGFLEMFELVPHVWAWWVLPVWAVGLAIAQLFMKLREG